MTSPDDDRQRPDEARLGAYLEELRTSPPGTDLAVVSGVTRSARWQRAIRGPLRTVGILAASVIVGIGAMIGVRDRSRR